jgi:hypothetical protein
MATANVCLRKDIAPQLLVCRMEYSNQMPDESDTVAAFAAAVPYFPISFYKQMQAEPVHTWLIKFSNIPTPQMHTCSD